MSSSRRRPRRTGTAEPYSGASLFSKSCFISPGSEPAKTYEATSPWNWMWLLRIPSSDGHLAHVLELVERDQRPEAAGFLEPQRQVEQRVQRRQRVGLRFQLKPRADPERAEREPEARLLEELLDAAPDRAPQLLRVCALEADGHVGERDDAVQVDEHRHEPLLLLAVRENSPEQARLAVLARRVQPDVVAADRVLQQVLRLLVAVDDLLGRDRPRVDERVDVGDHGSRRIPVGSPSGYRSVSRQTTIQTPTGRHP